MQEMQTRLLLLADAKAVRFQQVSRLVLVEAELPAE